MVCAIVSFFDCVTIFHRLIHKFGSFLYRQTNHSNTNTLMTEITIEQAIEQIAHQFSQVDLCYGHGTSNPWEEAAWAVHHVLGLDFGQGPDVYKRCVTPEQLGSIQSLALERIKTRKPMAYLTNKMWFAGLEFYVDERT